MIKKLFKCDTTLEELDDYETSKTKTDENTKGFQLADYLVPLHAGLPCSYSINAGNKKTDDYNITFIPISCTKIHLPPPEQIL